MKCISLKQPYAELLAIGKKTIETRGWSTKFRGIFLIHASKTIDVEACKYYEIDMDNITKGAIIGKAVIYNVKRYPNNNEFVLDKNKHLSLKKLANNKNMYGFLIKDAVKFDNAVPCLGKMGFFDVHES
ncbi:MAG: ASCH domain-containing protein [Nitrosopumilus sp.]|nr:ASCH domain-containing protein [Nitrosopumilus sp.]